MSNEHLGTILVVEDDPAIRSLVSLLLTDEGYRVISCDGALAAIETQTPSAPDLVLLDIVLGETDGVTLAQELRERYGDDLKILAMSAISEIDKYAGAMGAMNEIEKPFNLDQLVLAVKEALQAPPQQPTRA